MNEPTDPRMLDALRRDREAPVADEARRRVASRLGVDGATSSPLPPRSSGAASGVRWRVPALVMLAFVAGGAVGAALHARFAPAPAPRAVTVPGPGSLLAAPVPPIPTPPSAPGSSAPGVVLVPSPGPSAPSSLAAARVQLAQLDAERALLDSARAALVAGDSDTALQILDRHVRTYRHPLLGEERDALLVQSLVRAGRFDEARSHAEAFRRAAPQSLLLPAVESAIDSIAR
jgi:hypothetical protein